VITHGLPRPQNLQLARDLESIIRTHATVPATIAVLNGRVCVGLESDDLEALAANENARKLSSRDLASAIADKATGGTTVAATLRVATMAGIRVFATGGIGGVHRGSHWDVSADLPELARTPVVVMCAGAKAILDLPATLEWLETAGVPVIGFQTDEFPAFYSRTSGLKLEARAESASEVAAMIKAKWQMGLEGGVLIAAPIPEAAALAASEIDAAIEQALAAAEAQGVIGKLVTPYLLAKVAEITGGVSLRANVALLENNARVAAEVAKYV